MSDTIFYNVNNSPFMIHGDLKREAASGRGAAAAALLLVGVCLASGYWPCRLSMELAGGPGVRGSDKMRSTSAGLDGSRKG